MRGIAIIYEFDALTADAVSFANVEDVHVIPVSVFKWLEEQCQRNADDGDAAWLRLTQRRGRPVVQVTSFVGVIRAPSGYQIEVLPKIGKRTVGGDVIARRTLIKMLRCLERFRHIQTDHAELLAERMPLMEVFISEFLREVGLIVRRGIRSAYVRKEDQLFALRGKLLMAQHLRQNLFRADRFFTEHDEYSTNRPENRLLHTALSRVVAVSTSQHNQRLARELQFVFADVPCSSDPRLDFQRVRLDRGMGYYADALAWAQMIIFEKSPLTGTGTHSAPSLLFPMEAVFEAFVAKHLAKQLMTSMSLKKQARSEHLVSHLDQNWFLLKPDMLIVAANQHRLVLDAKWKLLDGTKANGTDKYGLSQGDFYQLQAYGQSYLKGIGDVVLIYPRTSVFDKPLPVFNFNAMDDMRLWVLPFCIDTCKLIVPSSLSLQSIFT